MESPDLNDNGIVHTVEIFVSVRVDPKLIPLKLQKATNGKMWNGSNSIKWNWETANDERQYLRLILERKPKCKDFDVF